MIQLYDTMARKKRDFVPGKPDRVTMYVCGPTVYGRAHIGNARPAVVFDTLRRLLEHEFPERQIVYARNVTDVDDKIIAAAEAERVEPAVITERFERFYLEDMGALGVAPPTIAPHATAEIAPMIAMIATLIERGNAYAVEGHVLFSVPSDPDYGALSRRDRDSMVAGARVEVAPYKRDPADFVLWKPSADGVIGWDSPWGRGRPGWHIECSAMIKAHLGDTIDIHGGGLDLIFPHHENEIAQSRCAHGGAPLARYWVHNGFVDMGAEKMSKSVGNVVTPADLLAQGHRGETLRLALLSTHYRQPLPWTGTLLEQSKARADRWYNAKLFAHARIYRVNPPRDFIEALQDDLNTAKALSIMDQLASEILEMRTIQDQLVFSGRSEQARELIRTMHYRVRQLVSAGRLLGLLQTPALWWLQRRKFHLSAETMTIQITPSQIRLLIRERVNAKEVRDFATADKIRTELKTKGVLLDDTRSGTTWRWA